MSLAAGKLRHRVRIEEQVHVSDEETGAVSTEWRFVAVVWAAIEPLSAREFVAAATTQSGITARITIRYRPGMRASMRILHGESIYNIAGVLPDLESGREYLTLPCSAGVNDGQ